MINTTSGKSSPTTPPPKKLSLTSKGWFLTYPRCSLPKEVAFQELEQRLAPEQLLVAAEKHEDGTPHLHVYMGFEKKKQIRDCNAKFDLQSDKENKVYHGNYQSAGNWKRVAAYCKKDQDFIEKGIDIKAKQLADKSKRSYLGSVLLKKEKPLTELVQEFPQLVFEYK
ncbi:replication protein, partial [uncultured marine virus]